MSDVPQTGEINEALETDAGDDNLSSVHLSENATIYFDIKCRLECLVHDLRRFKSDSGAMSRVEQANMHPFCFGPPYLSPSAGETLLNLALSDNSSVREYLGGMAGGKGYHICTSHTLAPALVHIFELADDFDTKSSFKQYYSRFCSSARYCRDMVDFDQATNSERHAGSEKKKNKGKRGV